MKNVQSTSKRFYRMDRRWISFVKFILEAYDNTAVLTTLDSRKGMVQVTIAPGCETTVEGVMDALTDEYKIIEVDGNEAVTG